MYRLFIGFAAVGLLAHAVLLLWSRHEFTPAESMVAIEAKTFAQGGTLYHDPNTYPYTVSPYGILFYSLSALLQLIGLAPLAAGRLISFLSLLALFWSSWRILNVLVADRYARLTGMLLLAATANILNWGTIGQTDMLACSLSLAAFASLISQRSLWLCGALVVLAAFTKQTAIAEIPAILFYLFSRDRKSSVKFALTLATAATLTALTLNFVTKGQYFTNTILANLNPFSATKLQQQFQQFLLAAGGLFIVALAGFRRLTPLYAYSAGAFVIWLLTSPKIGSELNYQIEIMALLALCSAVTLDQLPNKGDSLLHIPLLLHLAVNFALTAKILSTRISLEHLRRTEAIELAPYLSPQRGRILSSNFDLLITSGRPIELDPWFYVLLTNAHRIDPNPLLKDLAASAFGTIILDQNVFAPTLPAGANQDTLFLPQSALAQIRQHYILVRHVPSPYLEGDYIYQPIATFRAVSKKGTDDNMEKSTTRLISIHLRSPSPKTTSSRAANAVSGLLQTSPQPQPSPARLTKITSQQSGNSASRRALTPSGPVIVNTQSPLLPDTPICSVGNGQQIRSILIHSAVSTRLTTPPSSRKR